MNNVQFTTPTMGDVIKNLPTDQTVPSHNEIQIMNTLFKEQHTTVNKILSGSKDMLLAGSLFILYNIPQVEELIRKLIPVTTTSPYIFLLVKTLLFVLTYFFLKNLSSVRN